MKTPNKYHLLVFTVGILISTLLRTIFVGFHHEYDVYTFAEWAPAVSDFKSVFTTECFCNYPLLGLLFSSGALNAFGGSTTAFLFYLSLFDALNVLLVYILLKQFNFKNSLLWAGVIGLLPSSWVGGALWGQIDTIGQSILLLYLILLVLHLSSEKGKKFLFPFLLGLLLSVALLTKQLLLFPVLTFAFLTTLIWLRERTAFVLKLISALVGLLLPIVLIDLYLILPDSVHFSHFEKIFSEGSEHVNFISGNGFNVWMLFAHDMNESSTAIWFLGLSPKTMGILITGIVAIWVFFRFWITTKKVEGISILAHFLIVYSIVFLAVNLFFSGTHERYLYHFYPFLIAGLLLLNASRSTIYLTLFSAVCYGLFVLGVLNKLHLTHWFYREYWAHRICFVIHFILFLHLVFRFKPKP